ncbi:MAG: hypothetical protein ACI9T7_000144 [Oleiphilaceae bacterium]|jgi:hypothetical protein
MMNRLDTLRRDFKSGKPIASFYPVYLANGTSVEEFTAHCNDCKRVMPYEHFRGVVYSMHNGNTIYQLVPLPTLRNNIRSVKPHQNREKLRQDGMVYRW